MEVSIRHQNGGEFYRLIFWKIPSLVGVLDRVKGGGWYRICGRRVFLSDRVVGNEKG